MQPEIRTILKQHGVPETRESSPTSGILYLPRKTITVIIVQRITAQRIVAPTPQQFFVFKFVSQPSLTVRFQAIIASKTC